MDDEVFDSITWEAPATEGYIPNYATQGGTNVGPGFKQATGADEERDPNDPKWEGFMAVSVRDPVKELPDTKDTYVSYLVAARVRYIPSHHRTHNQLSNRQTYQITQSKLPHADDVSATSSF
jgi:sorting nexin-4